MKKAELIRMNLTHIEKGTLDYSKLDEVIDYITWATKFKKESQEDLDKLVARVIALQERYGVTKIEKESKEEKTMKTQETKKATTTKKEATTKKEEKTMNKAQENKAQEKRPAITAATDTHLQSNSLDIEAEVFDKFAPLLKNEDLKIRRWACNKNLYTFYLGRGQVAEITFRRKDFRVACRPDYAPENYQARKSGYGLDAYTDEAELTGAVAEIDNLLDFYKQVQADKKAAKEKAAAEKKAAAAKKAEEKAKKEAAKKAEKEKKASDKKAVSKKEKKVAEKVAK